MKKVFFLITILASLVLTACAEDSEIVMMPNGDVQQATASIEKLPDFLLEKDENLQLVYQLAAQYDEELAQIPCYCGCGETAGHKNNLNCFVAQKTEDEIVWDDHGTRCQVCVDTAVQTVQMTQDGKSLQEIRKWVDENYKEGYAAPTPTPAIS